jgi:UPF0755 protein
MRKRQKRSGAPLLAILSLLLLAAACLVLFAAAAALIFVPRRAEQHFGPPAAGLERTQLIYLSAQLLLRQDDLNRPVDPAASGQPFEVGFGEPTGTMIQRLESEGLIADADLFSTYLQYSGLDTTLQAGEYELSPGMTPIQIAHKLQDATPTVVNFHILPGWRMEEIAASLPTSGLNIAPEAFIQAASALPQGYSFSQDLPPQASAEGFLFPDSYRLARDLTTVGLLNILLGNFDSMLTPALVDGFRNQNLTIHEAVTLASIVQREAMSEGEMPLIASVFLNRVAAGMKLDSDPTVQYGLGFDAEKNTWWTNPLSLEDLQFDSPYNTYLYPGLPPGPIANPGLAALQAVAFPAQTPYYYFRAACDGSGKHAFAETFEQHLGNECQ